MTFLETLRGHNGGLLRLKSSLFWYGGRGWDGAPGRICLLLDAALAGDHAPDARAAPALPVALAVLLLIDGCPYWVWVGSEDVELIT